VTKSVDNINIRFAHEQFWGQILQGANKGSADAALVKFLGISQVNQLVHNLKHTYIITNMEMVMTLQTNITVKVKVKFSLEQAMKAQRGSRSIALLFL
jgi:hypothetical protein